MDNKDSIAMDCFKNRIEATERDIDSYFTIANNQFDLNDILLSQIKALNERLDSVALVIKLIAFVFILMFIAIALLIFGLI